MDYNDYLSRLKSLYSEYLDFDKSKIPLCAAENYVSSFVKQGLISQYEGKYISGYIHREQEKDFIGSDYLEKLLFLANDLAQELFETKYNDFRCLTGMNTVALIIMCMMTHNAKVLITGPESGGHGSLPKLLDNYGIRYEKIPFDFVHMQINYEKLNNILAHETDISYLFFCQSDIIQPPDLTKIRRPHNVGIIYDATQTLGLISGKILPNPIRNQKNIVMIGGTHKTFPGITCGYIATNDDTIIETITHKISPDFLRNVQVNNITSICLAMIEMLKYGNSYARSTVVIANKLGAALEQLGIHVKHVSDSQYTQTHQLFVSASNHDVDEAYGYFRKYGITLNKRKTQYIQGFRLGVQEIARYNFADYIDELAKLIQLILEEPERSEKIIKLKAQLAKHKTDRYIIDDLFMELD